jgi:hypothetical protein
LYLGLPYQFFHPGLLCLRNTNRATQVTLQQWCPNNAISDQAPDFSPSEDLCDGFYAENKNQVAGQILSECCQGSSYLYTLVIIFFLQAEREREREREREY